MKNLSKLTALVAATLTCGFVALAGPGDAGRPGKPTTPAAKQGGPGGAHRFDVPGVGGIPKNVELPETLKKALEEFNTARQKQIEIQKELASKLGTAKAEEKQALKEKLRSNRETFLDETKQLRTDIREQIKALREKLKGTLPVDGGDKGGKGRGRKDG